MTKTLKGGFAVESAFGFLEAQVGSFNSRQLNKKRQLRSLVKRLSTVATVLVLVTATNLTLTQAQEEPATESIVTIDSSLQLDSASFTALAIEPKTVEIKVGKSNAQIAHEAEQAKLAAVAAAKAKNATSVAVTASGPAKSGSVPTEVAHEMAQTAAAKAGIGEHWKILAAVWQKETGKSGDSCIVSRADGRATGPMQFMPSTFRAYAAPGANICKADDALAAAATLLKKSGLDLDDADRALFSYNHSTTYVQSVKQIAKNIQ